MFSFISRFFRSGKVVCPRCLGKGNVDSADIKRLKMELFWGEGMCAYCAGSGKVLSSTQQAVRPDLAYLTIDTPHRERLKLFNRDESSLKRARDFEAETEKIIEEIEHLYFNENLNPETIADSFEGKYHIQNCAGDERKAMIDYIGKVIQRRLDSA